jgi:ABC-type branched-subunit amino acid transport system ATPase component
MMKQGTPVLRLYNLTKYFDGLKAVDSITMEFVRGRITGLIGPNGAGKTTIFNLISGFLKPDKGEIWLEDKRIDRRPPWVITRCGLGRLFQDVRVFRKITVLENVLLSRLNHPGEFPLNILFAPLRVGSVEKDNIKEARYWIEFVGLKEKENSPAESLSFGQQKLLAIARLLAGGHRLLLLDEPTAGVNPVMIKPLLELITKIVDAGRTAIFIEHNMNVVLEIADWVYFLDEGRITSFGLATDVLGDPEIRKSYLGM